MPPDARPGLVLAFDTSGPWCAAAILRRRVAGGQTTHEAVTSRAEAMDRGQVERLLPLLGEVLAEAGATWGDLVAIGCGIGPGNFTGIRISVAAARAMAMALDIPAVGVTGFDAVAPERPHPVWVAIEAGRGQVYLQRRGQPMGQPHLAPVSALDDLDAPLLRLSDMPPQRMVQTMADLAGILSRIPGQPPPAPLYLRPADALPPRDPPPVILP